LRGNSPDPHDSFGYLLDVDEQTLLVATFAEGPVEGDRTARAYVFVQEGDRWVQQATLTPWDAGEQNTYLHAVAIDKDTAAINVRVGPVPAA
jgi:hypothetical protein